MKTLIKTDNDGNILATVNVPDHKKYRYSDYIEIEHEELIDITKHKIIDGKVQDIPIDKSTEIKKIRQEILSATDWTQMPDVKNADKKKWQKYRQELRDITKQEGYPDNVIWPILER